MIVKPFSNNKTVHLEIATGPGDTPAKSNLPPQNVPSKWSNAALFFHKYF